MEKRMLRVVFLLLASVAAVTAQISRQECTDLGGQVIGDIGNGSIFQPGYRCESDGLPPIDVIVPEPGEPIAFEGEVCCGSGGDETNNTTAIVDDEVELTMQECMELGGIVVVVDSDDDCPDQEPPLGVIVNASSATSRQGGSSLCCNVYDGDDDEQEGDPLPFLPDREEYTRQECLDNNGTIVGDIGNGAIFEDDYICESNGQPPVANIVQSNETSIAIEGEVCCGQQAGDAGGTVPDPQDDDENDREEFTRQECTDQGGEIVGDIGDGSSRRDDYICDSNGEPPLANIVPAEGEPIAFEGEVCCGLSSMIDASLETDMPGDGASVWIASAVHYIPTVATLLWTAFM